MMADDSSFKTDELLYALISSIGICGVVGNILVCVTVSNTKTLHNLTNHMILNLAVADALVCVAGSLTPLVPHCQRGTSITLNTEELKTCGHYNGIKWVHYYLMNCFCAQSVFSLTLATFERFIGITQPLQYLSFFTQRKITLLLLATWVIPFILEMPRVLYHTTTYPNIQKTEPIVFGIISATTFLLPVTAMIRMYTKILTNLKRGARNLEVQGIRGPPQQLHRAHKKVTSALAVITVAFFILKLPGKLWITVVESIPYPVPFAGLVGKVFMMLTLMNSAINPVLYGFKYQQLRVAFKSMLCRWCNHLRKPNRVDPSVITLQSLATKVITLQSFDTDLETI